MTISKDVDKTGNHVAFKLFYKPQTADNLTGNRVHDVFSFGIARFTYLLSRNITSWPKMVVY